jgi:ADP-heptose:LPS heptosyltransferase
MKQWSVDKFKELAVRLENELGNKVIIIGGKEEADKSQKYFSDFIDLTGKTTLVELAALLKKCKLLISGDSGPVHLASCVGTPVVAIFRNDTPGKGPVRWGPVSAGSSVVEKTSLQDITVEEVFDKVKTCFGCV